MTRLEDKIGIRPFTPPDIDAMFSIEREIEKAGKVMTWADLPTERVATVDRSGTIDKSGLQELGLIAEVDGHVRGFILGRVAYVGEPTVLVGLILIVGVHPDYQKRGIATRLVNAICEEFRSAGLKTARVAIDQRDKVLVSFFDRMGFGVRSIVDYSKDL
jgi:ribosomal protein S18 acetylase RimI-like enzyme